MKRYLGALLLLPFFPLRLLWWVVAGLRFALWRRRTFKAGRYYVLDWAGEVIETEPEGRIERWARELFWPGDDGVMLSEVRALSRALKRRAPSGLIIRLGPLDAGYAKCMELRALLAEIARHTTVYVELGSGAGGRELLVASAAQHVSAPPSVHIAPVGAAATTFFGTRLLGRLGLTARVASRGRYKSAIEPFTREDRSEADREQTTKLVEGLDRLLVSTLAESRRRSEEELAQLMDDAPYSGQRAAERGLIDLVLREDELVAKLGQEVGVDHFRLDRGEGLVRGDEVPRLRLLPPSKKEIGLVMVEGAIVDRHAPQQLTQAAASEVIDDLRSAQADEDLAAVVLYVDSPGGSVAASDAILGAVRRLDQEKPVVAYFSDVAASGGYYIACGARRIVASPYTITGSIGVFQMLPDASRLLEKLEIAVDTVKLRRHADFGSPFRAPTEEEMQHSDHEVEEIYERFLELVATARKRPKDEVAQAAEGRVWLGQEAHAQGLVDELGGLETALAAARTLAAVPCEEVPRRVRTKRRAQDRLPVPRHPDPAAAFVAGLGALRPAEARLLRELWWLRSTGAQASWLYAPFLVR